MEARCIALREASERLERALRSAVPDAPAPSTSPPSEEVAASPTSPPSEEVTAPPTSPPSEEVAAPSTSLPSEQVALPSASPPSVEVPTELPEPPATALPASSDAPAVAEVESKPQSGRFAAFTVEKYNRTIGNLKERRVSLAGWTVALAAVISGVLVTLSLLAHEPAPPIWFAALPAVWMVCVPFFVVSFLSTQRVLRRNHLVLPEAS